MAINFRPDDSGLQTLKQENTKPAQRVTEPLQAITRIQAVDKQPRNPPETRIPAPYTGPERRQGERRKDQARVILDTRGKRERRRQVADPPDGDEAPKRGIDVYG